MLNHLQHFKARWVKELDTIAKRFTITNAIGGAEPLQPKRNATRPDIHHVRNLQSVLWSRRAVFAVLLVAATIGAFPVIKKRVDTAAMSLLLLRHGITSGIPIGSGGTHFGTSELPRVTPAYTASNATTGRVHSPMTAADLQTLLSGGSFGGHTLVAGDTILLQRGTLYVSGAIPQQSFGYFAGADTNPIRVMTSDTSAIPAPGERWIPATHRHAQSHFVGQSAAVPPMYIINGAIGWQFIGVQCEVGDTYYQYWGVEIGSEAQGDVVGGTTFDLSVTYAGGAIKYAKNGEVTGTIGQIDIYCMWVSLVGGNVGNEPKDSPSQWRKMAVDDLPDKTVFDRCEFSSNTYSKCRNVFYANCRETIWTGCHIWNEGSYSEENKGIGGSNVAGPWLVDNCLVASAGIDMLVGGSDAGIANLNPNDMTVRRTLFFKPNSWNQFDVTNWDGNVRVKKNHLEFKRGIRVLVEDCLFENDWEGNASQFWSCVAKVSNDGGTGQGALTHDVTFRYLRFKHCQGPFGVGARDNYISGALPAAPMHDISVYQCYSETLFGDLPGATPKQWMMQMGRTVTNLHLEHLTFIGDESKQIYVCWCDDSGASDPNYWTWLNLVFSSGQYGMAGDSFALSGNQYFTNGTGCIADNIHLYINGHGSDLGLSHYPTPPFTLYTTANDLVTDYSARNFRVNPALIGTGFGGRTPGADIDSINTRTAGCASGVWT